jgi:Protein of unknown function (DUF616)
MTEVAIVTSVYGTYDTVKPVLPQTGADVEWILVTDTPPPAEDAEGWTIVHDPRHGEHPNRAAKHPKFRPWEYTDAPASIWIDASFRVTSPCFAIEAIEHADPIAQFVHPWRDCLYLEAEVSALLPKYDGEPLGHQVEYYRACGHPERWGLWAAGVIARQHTPEIRLLGVAWMHEVNLWSFQDQVSQPYVLRKTGLRPVGLPGTHFANPWLRYEGSGRH